MCTWSHYTAMTSDPGYVSVNEPVELEEGDNPKHENCKKCGARKDEGVHHCSTCKRCVRLMDHHCGWIGNCVGQQNMKAFCLFLLYGVLIGTLQTLMYFYNYFYHYHSKHLHYLWLNPLKTYAIYYMYYFRCFLAYIFVPTHFTYEQLGFWPRDSNNVEIIPDDYDSMVVLDNWIFTISIVFTIFPLIMLVFLVQGVMSGSLYIDRLKYK